MWVMRVVNRGCHVLAPKIKAEDLTCHFKLYTHLRLNNMFAMFCCCCMLFVFFCFECLQIDKSTAKKKKNLHEVKIVTWKVLCHHYSIHLMERDIIEL